MSVPVPLAGRGRRLCGLAWSAAVGFQARSGRLRLAPARSFTGALLLLLALAAPAAGQASFDRPGGDYTNFPVRSGDPAACASRCERDPRCRAWSFSYPTGAVPNAVCWLKSQVTPWRPNPCCVSGVKGADVTGPHNPGIEFSIDRVGGDYRNVEVPGDPMGRTCDAICRTDARCRAWTYSRPGYYGGHAARCFLKDRVTLPRHEPCCISGVVR
jgi:PAN domain